jgi:putative hydrolase of the HAD superfamily
MDVVLFDLFGTLVTYESNRAKLSFSRTAEFVVRHRDSQPRVPWFDVWDHEFVTLETLADDSGIEFSMDKVYENAVQELGLDPLDRDLGNVFIETFLFEWRQGVRKIPGVNEMLQRLVARNVRIGLVTNTHSEKLVTDVLGSCDLLGLFEARITSVQFGLRKPRPEIFLKALEVLNVSASDTIFVGDSYLADYVGAESVGVDAYLVACGKNVWADTVPSERKLMTVLDAESIGRVE